MRTYKLTVRCRYPDSDNSTRWNDLLIPVEIRSPFNREDTQRTAEDVILSVMENAGSYVYDTHTAGSFMGWPRKKHPMERWTVYKLDATDWDPWDNGTAEDGTRGTKGVKHVGTTKY